MTVESKFMLDKYWKFKLTVSTRGPWRRRILGRRQGWRLRRHSRRRGGRWALGGGRRRYKRRRQWRRRRDSRRSRRRCQRGRGGGDCGGVLPDVPWGGAAQAVKRPGRAPRWQHRGRIVVQGIHTFGTSVSPVSFTEPRNRRFSFILRCSLRGTCSSTNSLEARADDSLYRRNLFFTIFLFFFFFFEIREHTTRGLRSESEWGNKNEKERWSNSDCAHREVSKKRYCRVFSSYLPLPPYILSPHFSSFALVTSQHVNTCSRVRIL